MRKEFKIFALVLIVPIIAVTLLGCTPRSVTQQPAGGGHFIFAWVSDLPTWDPDRTTWSELPQSLIYDGLVELDMDGNVTGRLARRWELSEDGLRWRFFLREDVYFHSGRKMTADAVKFRFDRMRQPDGANRGMVSSIQEVNVIDTYTVEFVLSFPDPTLWNIFGSAFFGAIIDPVAVAELGEEFGAKPVGTGPWIIEEHVSGSHLTLRRNENYRWGATYWDNQGPPHMEKITFRFIPDETTRMLEIAQGSVDYTFVPPGETARLRQNNRVNVITYPGNGITYWGFNMKKWPWTDESVRNAMQFAINKEGITQHALEGLARPLWSALPPSIAGFNQAHEDELRARFPFSPDRARATLEAGGWVRGTDGIYAKDGQSLRVSVWVRNDPLQVRIAEMIESDLAAVGVDLVIEIVEQARITSDTPQGLHQSLIWQYGWWDPIILWFVFRDGGIRMHHVNEELHNLLLTGHQTVDNAERMQIYLQAQRLLAEQNPWVVLYFPEVIVAFSDRVENIRINHRGPGLIVNDLRLTR